MTPYITVSEYRQAPTAVDTTNLVRGGSAGVQDAELANVIRRASAWCDNFANQPLVASTRTEWHRITVNGRGELVIKPDTFPIVSLTSYSYGANGSQRTSGALTGVWPSLGTFVIPFPGGMMSSAGPLEIGATRMRGPLAVQYTYVAGYPTSTLAATASSGATSLTVADATGIVTGTQLTIYDAERTETVTATGAPTGNVVPVTATLYTHTYVDATPGNLIGVSGLPDDLHEAAILATSAFVKSRGNEAMVMGQSTQPGGSLPVDAVATVDLRLVREILASYRRIR